MRGDPLKVARVNQSSGNKSGQTLGHGSDALISADLQVSNPRFSDSSRAEEEYDMFVLQFS